MALPLRCAASLRLADCEPLLFIGSSTRRGQRPVRLNEPLIGKSETCPASEWQSHCNAVKFDADPRGVKEADPDVPFLTLSF